MIAAGPLLLLSAVLGAGEVHLALPRFDASSSTDGNDFVAVTIGTLEPGRSGSAWRRARTRFDLADPVEPGHWTLCLGPGGLDVTATLNGHALAPISDAFRDDARLCAGPRFDVAAEFLVAGSNALELLFAGPRFGAGFEAGPAYLLSPMPSARLRVLATARDPELRLCNGLAAATVTRSGSALERVLFSGAGDGADLRLAAQVDLAVLDAKGEEIALHDLSKRQLNLYFPSATLQVEDPRLASFNLRMQLVAPIGAMATAHVPRAVLADLTHITRGQEADFTWHVRLFPAVGGPLRITRAEGCVVLHNDAVGFFAEKAKVLGTDEAPVGLELHLRNESKPGTFQSMVGPSMDCGVVGAGQGGLTVPEFAARMVKGFKDAVNTNNKLASTIATEPISKNEVGIGMAGRMAVLAALAARRPRGEALPFAPPEGAASGSAYFGDLFTLLHEPALERSTVEWELSTQEDSGSIRGDLVAATSDAPPLLLLEGDVYAVLRACRYLLWTWDGNAFAPWIPKLARALDHAAALGTVEQLGRLAAAHPPPLRRASLAHLALARVAAGRAFAASLLGLGKSDELAATVTRRADQQLEELLRDAAQGGLRSGAGFTTLAGEDPREQVVALAFHLLPEEGAAALAVDLDSRAPRAGAIEWLDPLLARALLEDGRVAAGRSRVARVEAAIAAGEPTLVPAFAGHYGAIVFGLLGVRRGDFGTLEVMPRMATDQQLRTSIRFPEGTLRLQLLAPDAQLRRQMIVFNDSTLDLLVAVGVPGNLGSGAKTKVGEMGHSIYEQMIEAGQTWREQVR